jgi:hypothetical protein
MLRRNWWKILIALVVGYFVYRILRFKLIAKDKITWFGAIHAEVPYIVKLFPAV